MTLVIFVADAFWWVGLARFALNVDLLFWFVVDLCW